MKFFTLFTLFSTGLVSLTAFASPISSNDSLTLSPASSATESGLSVSVTEPVNSTTTTDTEFSITLIPTSTVSASFNSTVPTEGLEKRAVNARMTYYDITTGITACGKRYRPSDYVVALNGAEFGDRYPSPQCFKKIRIKVGSKSADAIIVDKCPGCPRGGLDLTEGLFKHFAPLSKGVLTGSWNYI
ncbi:Non-catalytic module family EXPN [Pyrrhoderma noxium]|uniref:Non-catalytic module family EXPN n=1 Tax=Pyrrhoderma noxium TaxID=2282107 RepID=A0A286UTN0_9AGAM|nr:Non-catalytic module family EXPN [Pyrrhoderma noxium]